MKKKNKKIRVTFLPEGKKVTLSNPIELKELIKNSSINFSFPCGGLGICGKCKVKISGRVNPLTLKEKKLIPEWIEKGYRLACQVRIEGDAKVEIPSSGVISELKFLTQGLGKTPQVNPGVEKIYLPLPSPSLKDQLSDVTRIKNQLIKKGYKDLSISLDLVRKVPTIIRKSNFNVTVVLKDREIIAIEKGDTRGKKFGLAFDIGTTTVVGALMDLDTGERIAERAILNPQVIHGDDIISRISYIQSNPGGLKKLQRIILKGINQVITYLVSKAKVKRDNIYEATFVGNTVMQHILAGINPVNLALYPYVPAIQDSISINSSKLGIKINSGGKVYIFPSIAAFVGGDTVGVILTTELHHMKKGVKLAVDIGTNGEIVLSKEGKLVVASTAAGPAFEGARISQGMWAQEGAIEGVKLENGEVKLKVIGEVEPRGICGSGLLDAVSEFFREGIVDRSGRIKPRNRQKKIWRERIKEDDEVKFILTENKNNGYIYISQKDVREFQLAKAAICAGIKILLKTVDLQEEIVEEVLLAGAFGNYINIHSAYNVGLFPFFPNARVRIIGNAASLGAIKALISKEDRQEAELIPSLASYVELAAQPYFQDILTNCLFLGESKPP